MAGQPVHESVVARSNTDDRIRRLWDRPINCIYHASFDDRKLEAEIVGPAPEVPVQRLLKAPAGLPAYLASLYEVPLLSAAQERHYFRKMNYLKHRAARLRNRLKVARVTAADLDRLEDLLRQADEVKNVLIRSNLRLVVSVVRKFVRANLDFSELISEGNLSLMRAIENFDFSRGFKFSTYGVWAVRNNLSRSLSSEHSHRERFRTGAETIFGGSADRRSDGHREELLQAQRRETVNHILGQLSERERAILTCRFGLMQGTEPQTLEQVGARQGVSKERVRQLEKRAISKLRELAGKDLGPAWSMQL